MSGAPSVPLALATYFVSSDIAKFGLFSTAIACAVLSSYWIWKVEREARILSEAQLKDALEAPLRIVFDVNNPNNRFWSMEPMQDENGDKIAGSFWEYRVSIKNISARTARNVMVTLEAIGPMPRRPALSNFDVNKQSLIDLHPGRETLATIIRWPVPISIPGMISRGGHGPIKIIASADDLQPTEVIFQFDPNKTPMIYYADHISDGQGQRGSV
jgi:hypothetical protein